VASPIALGGCWSKKWPGVNHRGDISAGQLPREVGGVSSGMGSPAIKPQFQAMSLDTASYLHTYITIRPMRNRLAKAKNKEDRW
jgi:hypothetical protein